ncbi:MAG: ribbon-helix-helix domain-containing protein [Candidatus Bathyarchaeota archaeon]|nr:ribbon-helix-helix domain-containing protein [Candidatus Termiticorpusculum sp.]
MSEDNKKSEHVSLRIPESLTEEMDQYIGHKGFTSRAEVAKQAIREYIDRNPLPQQPTEPKLPRYERVNADDTGCKILDRKIPGNRIVHVTFTPKGVQCDYHESSTCEHVEYALDQTDVKEMIKQKKKEGWKLPDI